MIVVMQQTTQMVISRCHLQLKKNGCIGIVVLIFKQDER